MKLNYFTKLIIRTLYSYKRFVGESVDISEVKEFVKQLHPYKTEHELIRIGGSHDGAYLVPDDLEGIEAIFSPGVDVTSNFELEFAKKNIDVYMADASVDGPIIKNDKFSFIKKYIGSSTKDEYITMEDWVNSTNVSKDSDLLLQMDIEGAEYESILDMSPELMNRFRIILIEVHDLNHLLSLFSFKIIKSFFLKILKTHYCVHNHPNNGGRMIKFGDLDLHLVMEFSFIRKDRVKSKEYATEFPHPLDQDNKPQLKSYTLPNMWYHTKKSNSDT